MKSSDKRNALHPAILHLGVQAASETAPLPHTAISFPATLFYHIPGIPRRTFLPPAKNEKTTTFTL